MKKTYHIITIGCQMNKSDSERIVTYLEENGYERVERKKADLVIINTCGIRQKAEDRIYGLVSEIKKAKASAKIVIAGCLSERKDVIKRLEDRVDVWLPIIELPEFLNMLNKKSVKKVKNPCDYLKIKAKYQSKISAFVPIGNGCNNFCSYCVVPYARGREVYRPFEEILAEVELLLDKGYKEITLIAQNVNSYNYENYNFVDLLKAVNDLKGDFWLRFSTSHPKDMSDDLINILPKCKKVCEHIHLPAQAGNNEILQAMNRKYSIEHYKELIRKIRETQPQVSFTTDIIVGFPGETEEQFNDTLELFKEIKYDMAYISQYSPRYGTASQKLKDDVSRQEKKRREEDLMKVLRKTSFENNKKLIGKTVEILVEGKNRKGEWYGKTRTSKVVKIEVDDKCLENLKGKFVKVKIEKVQDFGLRGELFN